MTNMENIQSMSKNDLINLIYTFINCKVNDCWECPFYDLSFEFDYCGCALIKKWLESEVAKE